jgi:molybdate transport system ATP-binding protein
MRAGTVLAAGPLNVLQSDESLPLAGARDVAVTFDATVGAYDATYGIVTLQMDGGQFLVPASPLPPGERRRLRIAAGDVSLAHAPPKSSTILNALPARIMSSAPVGESEIIAVVALRSDGSGARLLARVTRRSWNQLGLADGMSIHAQVKGVSLALK